MNERIRAREVRLIDEKGAQLGVMPIREALRIAQERELDLIEVAPSAQPPVCRIMDYGKHKYQQARRDREAHKRSKSAEVRLLRLNSPHIGPHDLEIKLRKVREFLAEGSKVRVNIRFRGREMSRPQMGTALLNRIAESLADVGQAETSPRLDGRMMNMMVAPKPQAAPPKAKPKAPPREDRKAAPAEAEKAPQAAAPTEATAPPAQAEAEQAAPPEIDKVVPSVENQVQEQRPQPPAQAQDAEDSGEAG